MHGSIVTNIAPGGIYVGNEFTPVRNVFWAAGVRANPIGQSLGVPLDRAGRVIVGEDLTIPGHPNVFIAGDMAAATSADMGLHFGERADSTDRRRQEPKADGLRACRLPGKCAFPLRPNSLRIWVGPVR